MANLHIILCLVIGLYYSNAIPIPTPYPKQKEINVVPPQSWGDQGDTKHSKCLLLGGRWLNQMTLIPTPNGSGGARVGRPK